MAKKEITYQPTIIYDELECSLDEKFRVLLPAALKKKISEQAENTFVIIRGDYNNLVLYAQQDWEVFSKNYLSQLNPYNEEHALAIENLTDGLTTVTLDAGGRLLLPKILCADKKIKKDLVLKGMGNTINIWEKKEYLLHKQKMAEAGKEAKKKVIGGFNFSNQQP